MTTDKDIKALLDQFHILHKVDDLDTAKGLKGVEPEVKAHQLIRQLLDNSAEDFIRSGWGKPCRTKDTHDFPELLGDPLANRCPTCEIWEHYYDYAQGMYESPEVSTDE